MEIKQFYDTGLAHASYAVVSDGVMAVIDPARDPKPYYDFAQEKSAKIVAVIETHPHADFVSSHLEIHQTTGAQIYVSQMVAADYPSIPFDEGAMLTLGKIQLKALNTPGHSPDSISVILVDETGKQHAVFTGDTLFVGDVGRPDLREKAGNMTAKREELARAMYRSTRDKLMLLDDEVLVYPAHGAGSLCGKNLSPDTFSTIGREKRENYALSPMSEEQFVDTLLDGQPFIPKYFGFAVEINKNGAKQLEESLRAVPRLAADAILDPALVVVDARPAADFKAGHLPKAINLQNGGKFETWLGSIVGPEEKFYLLASDEETREALIYKSAKIGYEINIAGALVAPAEMPVVSPTLDFEQFKQDPSAFTVVDIRNEGEYAEKAFFAHSQNIPLPELRERTGEIPTDKPVVVHCAAGYRSAAGSAILEGLLPGLTVYDLGENVEMFK